MLHLTKNSQAFRSIFFSTILSVVFAKRLKTSADKEYKSTLVTSETEFLDRFCNCLIRSAARQLDCSALST
jgi:hypothetical protein